MSEGYLVRHYGEYEFCKSVECGFLTKSGLLEDRYKCITNKKGCSRTAKEFHKWLSANGFMIAKKEESG